MHNKNRICAVFILILIAQSIPGYAQKSTSEKNEKVSNILTTILPGVSEKATVISQTATPGPEQPASSRITDGREPSEVVGYITWVDPDTNVKHLIKGQDRRTGQWEVLNIGSNMLVQFKNVSTQAIFRVNFNGGAYYTGIDNAGRDVGNSPYNWNETRMPVALKYRFIFSFDLNYTGNPVISDVPVNGIVTDQTIRYNPNLWKFHDISCIPVYLEDPRSSYSIPLEDFPVRPADPRKRATRFLDLPEF